MKKLACVAALLMILPVANSFAACCAWVWGKEDMAVVDANGNELGNTALYFQDKAKATKVAGVLNAAVATKVGSDRKTIYVVSPKSN